MSNWFISWLLRSPFHGCISSSTMLITYIGRRSGKEFSTPVNYVRVGANLWVATTSQRTWWRNFKGEWPIKVLLQREQLEGVARAITDPVRVIHTFGEYLSEKPQKAKYFNVTLESDGNINQDDLVREAEQRVMVEIKI